MNLTSYATLARPATLQGVGLHSGQPVTVTLQPSAEVGFFFVRSDLPHQPRIPAAWEAVADTHHATTLRAGDATVSTVEHLLAALTAFGITHCTIVLDGPEIPILDGSAQPWCDLLHEAGRIQLAGQRPLWGLREPVWVEGDNGASLLGLPLLPVEPESAQWHLSCAVDFGHNYRQVVDIILTAQRFEAELAPARTFAREEWLPALRERGLIRGGDENNALLLREDGPSRPWRVPQELAAHKTLDVVGDLSLLTAPQGAQLNMHLIAVRAGHGVHRSWIAQAMQQDAFARF